MANMTTQEILQGIKDWAAPKVIYDISAAHNNTKYTDLSDALGTDGGNIPQEYRKGGITVRYVQSSDNKYVQYRLMANEWSTNTDDWAIADDSVYVENPEFVRVVLDKDNKILEAIRVNGTKLLPSGVEVNEKIYFEGNETTIIENPEFIEVKLDGAGHILWGIQEDGNIYFGAGVPQQVINYISEKIAELSLDEYEDIVAFLNDLEKGDKTLQDLLNGKVDKEEGKSLIDEEYAEGVHYIENPEFIEVKVDNEDKILEATEKDGTKLFGGDVKVLGSIDINGVTYKVVTNPEWLKVVLDSEDRIICGIKTDGKFVVYVADFLDDIEVIKERLEELDAYSVTENPEFMEVELDAEDKVLSGRKVDGTKFENNDVEFNGNATVGGSLEVDGVVIKNIEDPEGRLEIATDSENKIITYRKEDGTKVENVGIETSHLVITEGLPEFKKSINGTNLFPYGKNDWSGKDYIELSTPKLARVNFTNIYTMPERKDSNSHAIMEFYDGNGNYFRAKCIVNAQGDSSMAFKRKNFGIDICTDTDDWEGDETVKIKFGKWVPQDSFHIKAYSTDTFRCSGAICYKIYNQIMESRGMFLDRPYKRYYTNKISTFDATGKIKQDVQTNARCVPDGFPCIVYLNGDFYGVYSWQLKKHRDNYQMKKDNTKHIHLDGTLNENTIFRGTVDWTEFEVRNPKSLKDIDGNKYDGDHPKELSNTDEYTVKVKNSILAMSNYIDDIIAKEEEYQNETITIEDLKSYINDRFDSASMVDYILFCNITGNYDGLNKNWQWITYDGVKWFVADYDNDGTFGNYFNGNMLIPPFDTLDDAYSNLLAKNIKYRPCYWFYKYFPNEIKQRYLELKSQNILTSDNIVNMFKAWMDVVGVDNYERDYEKWTEQPCYRDSKINSDYWERSTFSEALLVYSTAGDIPIYSENNSYNEGDYVRFKDSISTVYFVFKCLQANSGEPIINGVYPNSEKPSFGHYDSIYRIKNWLDERISIVERYLESL